MPSATLYPTVNISTGTSFNSMLTYGNTVVNGYLGLGILLTLFLVVFMAAGGQVTFERKLLAASFITFVGAVLFVPLGLVSFSVIPILLVAVGALWLLTKD